MGVQLRNPKMKKTKDLINQGEGTKQVVEVQKKRRLDKNNDKTVVLN